MAMGVVVSVGLGLGLGLGLGTGIAMGMGGTPHHSTPIEASPFRPSPRHNRRKKLHDSQNEIENRLANFEGLSDRGWLWNTL